MKIAVKAIVLTALIMFAISIERKHNNHQTSNSEVNSNVPCEAGIFDVTVAWGANYANSVPAKFDAKDLETPSGINNKGFVFLSVGANDKKNQIFTETESKSYISYLLLGQSFNAVNPRADGAYITTVYNNKGTFIPIKLTFKYNPKWEYVSTEELNKIVAWINRNMDLRQRRIKELKDMAVIRTINYGTHVKASDIAGENSTKTQEEIVKIKNQIEEFKKLNEELQIKYQTFQNQIEEKKTKMGQYVNIETQNTSEAQTLQGALKSQEDQLKILQNDVATNTNVKESYETRYKSALNSINNFVLTYKEEAANYGRYMDEAVVALTSNRDVNTFNKKFVIALT